MTINHKHFDTTKESRTGLALDSYHFSFKEY
jgi:hypothetical protein